MNRRTFIKKSLWAVPAITVLPSVLTSCKDDELINKSVIVIGAGMAGLAAANKLKSEGLSKITLLEARNRVGGRLHTDRSAGVAFDVGASWIHGAGSSNPITDIARSAGATTVVTDDESLTIYDISGTAYSDTQESNSYSEYKQLLKSIESNGAKDKTVLDLIKQLAPDALTNRLKTYELSAYLEFDLAGDISRLSSLYFQDDEAFNGDEHLITNGYDKVSDFLAKGLDIKTEHKVTAIDYSGNMVTVTTDKGDFSANYVIVTIPLGVLKKGLVSFAPALPQPHQQAISRLEMGGINKVLCLWNQPFWDTNLQYIGYTPETKGKYNYFLNFRKFSNINALMTFAFADFGKEMENHSDAQVKADITAHLKNIYGSSVSEPVTMLRSKWNSDTFTYGSYSFAAVGSTPDDFESFEESVADKLFFAGEHTIHDYRGTVHGAFLSGERAAEQIIDL